MWTRYFANKALKKWTLRTIEKPPANWTSLFSLFWSNRKWQQLCGFGAISPESSCGSRRQQVICRSSPHFYVKVWKRFYQRRWKANVSAAAVSLLWYFVSLLQLFIWMMQNDSPRRKRSSRRRKVMSHFWIFVFPVNIQRCSRDDEIWSMLLYLWRVSFRKWLTLKQVNYRAISQQGKG